MLEQTQERAQHTAERTTSEAREEVGRRAFETLEQFFPEQAASRNQRNRVLPLLLGVAIGFLLRYYMDR